MEVVVVVSDTVAHSDGSGDTSVTCTHCDYEWVYSGDLQMVTCPSCQRKTPVQAEN